MIEGIGVRDIELDRSVVEGRRGPAARISILWHRREQPALGNPDATDDELWAALEVAQGRDFVEAMPLKLEAPIAQGGTNVSRRSAPAAGDRACAAARPAVYLFDDSFSALDLATEARLRAALRPHIKDATVIMVAQRVASIIDADQIIVLEAGAIVGRGRHAELVASCPTYVEIVTSQREEAAA